MIDAYVTQPHYAEHLWPVLEAVPEDRRGLLYAHHALSGDPLMLNYAVEYRNPPRNSDPLLVAGYQDLPISTRPRALLSHGAGQTYEGWDSGSYDGGPGREGARLHLCVNERAARKNADRYPDAIAVAIGCPKLDVLMGCLPIREPDTIAVAFHWRCTVVPEAEWAWPTWSAAVQQLALIRPVVGHCHPRARYDLKPWFRDAGIRYIEHPIDLWRTAGTLVVDNSSLGYEWAACKRPVAFMDGEQWRPDAQHGLRFGGVLPGPTAGASGAVTDLLTAIEAAPEFWLERTIITSAVYGKVDGHASERAVDAIMKYL